MASYIPTPYNQANPWPLWVYDTQASANPNTFPGTSLTSSAWPTWVEQTYITNSTFVGTYVPASTQSTWVNWNDQYWRNQPAVYSMPYTAPVLTAEQLAAQAQQQAAAAARVAAAHEERQVALVRARSLLDTVLSAEQRADLERTGGFHVIGSCGRRYRITNHGQAGNVHLDDPRHRPARFCCHPRESVPDPDAWLAQMLAIEHDENGFLATANLAAGDWPSDFVRPPALSR